MIDDSGTALAATGKAPPVCFGTWFWGLGMDQKIFIPKKVGAGFELPEELDALKPIRDHLNVYTNFNAYRDSSPLLCHYTGWVIMRTGIAPENGDNRPGEDPCVHACPLPRASAADGR